MTGVKGTAPTKSGLGRSAINAVASDGSAWLTAAEIAATFRVDRSTVYRWASAGVVPSLKIRGTRRFDAAAVDAVLRGGS
jgi:excisionase family DNA binding protein